MCLIGILFWLVYTTSTLCMYIFVHSYDDIYLVFLESWSYEYPTKCFRWIYCVEIHRRKLLWSWSKHIYYCQPCLWIWGKIINAHAHAATKTCISGKYPNIVCTTLHYGGSICLPVLLDKSSNIIFTLSSARNGFGKASEL